MASRSVVRLLLAVFLALFSVLAAAQDCSATKLCATGCCSKYGYCGVGDDFCGAGCQSTCNYVAPPTDCGPDRPCADGSCCSKFGFCGLGQKYCAPGVCVNGCQAKSDCDPGDFGSAYVISPKCPLNVCCSKWGYCGVDDQHCQGQPKPQRQGSSTDSPIRRVVGYYEGWASRRPCDQFYPEDVPVGVYSHLNFAFASIDPGTFAIVPADQGDVDLYKRLSSMKKQDPELKVYIAIGGWAFNDPGPTVNVFTQLAASEANQKAFFTSLISFMETYDFDGVDIDWEYPAADDRAGRPEDFDNYPTFIGNLKSAIASTSRGGLTVTLPVAYWYLRHFDIKKLEPHVDWFNMMSYDLHGSWDMENKWVGNLLNSHTNLTEITEYFDLMWRNDMDPAKVVMGLGFYSRTFKASSTACMNAGCTFSTVGDRGECTHEYGVLSNSEVTELIKSTGATADLDKTAAVKILKVGNEWITYDDVDTFKLKVSFARSECLGGVMVWAVSLDVGDGTYSKQLQQATGFQSRAAMTSAGGGGGGGGHEGIGKGDLTVRHQCFWTDCGAPCPANYVGIPRADSDGGGEIMLDQTGCRHNGGARTLCCPVPTSKDANLPRCGWYDFNNGQCGKNSGSQCDEGWAEVGSYGGACHGYGKWQVACCTSTADVQSMSLYAMCDWRGDSYYGSEGNCVDGRDYKGCSGQIQSYNLVDNWTGSGAHQCWWWESFDGFFRQRTFGKGAYCCVQPTKARRWANCATQAMVRHDDGYCSSVCPGGTVKVGLDDVGIPGITLRDCTYGGQVYCCEDVYKKTTTVDEVANPFEEALQSIKDHQGQCPFLGPASKRRSDDDETSNRGLVVKRGAKDSRAVNPLDACTTVADDLRKWAASSLGNTLKGYEKAWNDKITSDYRYLTTDYMEKTIGSMLSSLEPDEADHSARNLENNLDQYNDWAEVDSGASSISLCDFLFFYSINAYLDEDDGSTDSGPGYDYGYGEVDYSQGGLKKKVRSISPAAPHFNLTSRSAIDPKDRDEQADEDLAESRRWLDERADQYGNPRTFESKKGTGNAVTMRSSTYPNGDGGDQLMRLNGDTHRYMIKPNTATGYTCNPKVHRLDADAGKGDTHTHWVTEHILELQTVPRFIDFLIDQRWPSVKSVPSLGMKPTTEPIDMASPKWSSWSSKSADHAGMWPLDMILNRLGSVDNVDDMVVCDADLNGAKAQLYRFVRPSGNSAWNGCCKTTSQVSGRNAISILSNTIGVFDYYDSADVKFRHQTAYDKAKQILDDFEDSFKKETGRTFRTSLGTLWRVYLTEHYARVVTWAISWI
ncbi:hypothetical protein QBC46DRAFT_440079, partial [Diplogelasinospora grovesii]